MATLNDVLNTLNTTPVCVIDPNTRRITVPTYYQQLGVESDEKVNRVYFSCPKIVGDNIDLSTMDLYINYQNANRKKSIYLVTDAQVDGDNIIFSWLLSRNVTAYKGQVSYIVCAKKYDGTEVTTEWNTTPATGTVIVGLEATESYVEENEDALESILYSLGNKVDKENGKGLSSNDYTDVDKAAVQTISDKISSSEKGAANGVATLNNDGVIPDDQIPIITPDWNENNPTSKNYIQNRPGGYTVDSKTIEWDGQIIDESLIVDATEEDLGVYYKVSDHVFTEDDVIDGTIQMYDGSYSEVTISKNDVQSMSDGSITLILIYGALVLSINKPYPPLVKEAGTYFLFEGEDASMGYISSLSTKSRTVKIPYNLLGLDDQMALVSEYFKNLSNYIESVEITANDAKTKAESATDAASQAMIDANSAMISAGSAESAVNNKAEQADVESLRSNFYDLESDLTNQVSQLNNNMNERIDNLSDKITEVKSVTSLPENPDPNVLYLIREEG